MSSRADIITLLMRQVQGLLSGKPGELADATAAAQDDPELRELLDALQELATSRGSGEAVARGSDARLMGQSAFVRRVLDTDPNLIFVKDAGGDFLLVNQAVADFYGRPIDEFANLSNRSVRPDKRDVDVYASADHRVIANLETITMEEAFHHKDGSITWFRTTKTPLRTDDGRVCVLGIAMDITERREMEDELRQANQVAEAAALARTRFLANISHEMRTPLNGIIGVNGLLLASDLNDEQRECAETLQLSGDLLLTLINDVLDFSRLEYRSLTLDEHRFSPGEQLREIVRVYRHMAHERGLTLSATCDASTPAYVVCDRRRLSQILSNLVGNAIKFTDTGGVNIELSTLEQAGQASDAVVLRYEVKDTGIGIPANEQAKLFEPFSQLDDSTTRRHGGTGLGLAISKRLVELMDGDIWLASAAGRGSSFFFTVPARVVTSLADETPSKRATIPNDPIPPLRILVVEDNPINQKVMARLLGRLGQRAVMAENGAAALDALRVDDYDLVLMDLHMPVMDGFTATQRIMADWPEERRPVIIAVTADAMQGDRERCLAVGMHDYISKPVTLESVQATLTRWCAGR